MLHVILFIVFFFSQTFLFSQTTEKFGNLVLVPQSGHTGFINHISVSADNRYYLTSGNGKSILRSADGRMIRTFSDPSSENGINYSVLSPDGNFIIAVGANSKLLSIEGNIIQKLPFSNMSSIRVAFSKDSKFFLFSGLDHSLQLYNTKGILIKAIPTDSNMVSFDFSPDSKSFILGNLSSGNLEFWSSDGVLLKSIDAYSKGIKFVKFFPDGNRLLTVSNLGYQMKLWDRKGNLLKELPTLNDCFVITAEFSLDISFDSSLIVLSNCSELVLMDSNGRVIKKLDNVKQVGPVSFLGKTILVGDVSGDILRYDEKGNFISKDLKAANQISYMDYSENSILLNSGRLLSLDAESMQTISVETNNWGRFTKDNKFIILQEKDNLFLYDRTSKKRIRELAKEIPKESSPIKIPMTSLSANNRILVMDPNFGKAKILNLEGKILKSFDFKEGSFGLLYPNGNQVLTFGKSGDLVAINLNDKEIYSFQAGSSNDFGRIFFSTTGKYIFITTQTVIDVYDAKGKLLFTLPHNYVSHFISSPDEKLFLTSSVDNTVKLWDQNGKLLKTISGYEGSITGLAFSKDGKFVLTSSRDGLIRFFKIADGSLAVSILPTEYGIIIISPDGRFDYADNRALQFLSYRKGGTNELISLDQVFQSYYTPDLFKKIINGTLPKSNLDISSALKKNLPELKLEIASDSKNGKVDLNIEACDKGGGLQNIAVYQNGNLIHEENYTALTQTGACKTGTVTLNLADGQNAFKVSAYNSANIKAESPTRAVTYVSPESLKPQLHILMVAIDDYVSVRSKLKFAVKDAIGLKESLQKYGKGAFGKVNFYEVYNAAGVKPGIVNAFKNVKNNAKLNDTVIVFFSGHGMSVDGKFYFISQNITDAREIEAKSLSDFNQKYQAWEKFAKQASISSDEISQAITQIKAKNKMLIVDSCYSGGGWLSKVNEAKVEEKMEDQKSDMVKKSNLTGIAMISAAQAFQKANENGEIGHGFLTFGLLEAMKIEKDRGKITAFSVIPEAAKKVRDLSIQYQKKQIPFQSTSGVDFELSD